MAPHAPIGPRSIGSRLFAVALAVALALALLPSSAVVAPENTLAATARVGPFGTATIDGVQTPGEWDAAAAVSFTITMSPSAGGAATVATLFLMNDARNLYVAVRAGAVWDRLMIGMSFDRDRDGTSEIGDDRLEVELPRSIRSARVLPLRDRFWGRCSADQCFTWLDDTQSGSGNPPAGSTDGQAAGAFDLVSGYVELSHPLASADSAHDLQVSAGAVVGFRLDASVQVGGSYGGSGTVPVQECLVEQCLSNSTADLVIATARGHISTPQEVVSAIRVEGLSVKPSAALPGTELRASFKVVNRSSRTLLVPLDPSGRYLGGRIEEWLARLGSDPSIGARNQYGDARIDEQPIDILRALGGTSWPPGVSITLGSRKGTLRTMGHPPGDYRYTVRRFAQPPSGPSVQAVATRFALKGVRDEWRASIGSGGRNGAATLRAWSTDDGSLSLTLRGLRARTSYAVTIRRASCSGALVTTVGSARTGSTGKVRRTLALSRSKTSVILAAAAKSRLVLRVGTGSPARCGTLAAVPLYDASLVWRLQTLPGTEGDPARWPHGAALTSIAATSTTLVAAGYHLKNDCTWEPVNRTWHCPSPTRRATAVWTSADGHTWTEQILGADTGPGLVVAGSGRLVVVANGAAWWSTDGRSWMASGRPPVSTVTRSWDGGSGQVSASDAGFIAVLPTQPGPAGCRDRASPAWATVDGQAWEQLPYDPDLVCLEANDVLDDQALIVVAGSDSETGGAAIAISRDRGATWERAVVGTAAARATTIDTVTETPSGYAAYGRLDGGRIGIWTSRDALTWRAASAVAAYDWYDFSWVADAVPFGPGYVLVGGSAAAADHLRADVLVSGDGVTLRWAPWVPQRAETTLSAAAVWRERLYVVGTGGAFFADPAVPLAWTADLAPSP